MKKEMYIHIDVRNVLS